MLFTITDIAIAAGCIASLAVGIQLLRLSARICSEYPIVGLIATVGLMGWAHQHPDALPQFNPSEATDTVAQRSHDEAELAVLGAEVSDEDMVADYHKHNARFYQEVTAAPDRARRMAGL